MPHLRAQIRDALATRLTGLATTGSNVFANREHVFAATQLPGLRVFVDDEQVESSTIGGHRQARRATAIVEIAAKEADANLDDVLDQVALEVEVALAGDQTLGGLANGGVLYEGIDGFRRDDGTNQPVGVWPMRFSVNYDVNAANPASAV